LRLRERGIKRADVINCIQSGEIIEQYLDDMPFPSCLILGGEAYFTDDVMQRLEAIIDRPEGIIKEVAIVDYTDVA
jgi:hypothetical protein